MQENVALCVNGIIPCFLTSLNAVGKRANAAN